MIAEVDTRLVRWAEEVVGKDVGASLSPPGDDSRTTGVSIYLLDLLHRPATGNGRSNPHRLLLRYLITVGSAQDTAGHTALAALAFAALETPDFEVEMEPLPLALWTAMGVRPRPAFVLRLPITKPRATRPSRAVTQPLRIEQAEVVEVRGRLLGPSGVPIAAAHIELPGLGRHATTDSRGWFRLRTIPLDPRPRSLCISARGRSETRFWEDGIPLTEPLEIHMELEG